MQTDLSNVKIDREEKLIELVNQMNKEIAFHNRTKSKEEKKPLLDSGYILKRYRRIKFREDVKVFRTLHDCEYCHYFQKPRRCRAANRCPLEEGKDVQKNEMVNQKICPKDKEGKCPYSNDVETCFGFCWKEILSEFHKNKKREAGIWKEEKDTGQNKQ